ncbi:MAG: 50S ribosomal protein L6 [Patescibacteria group bacterium]
MSRIGKQPIVIPNGVTVTVDGSQVMVKGPKGSLSLSTHPLVHLVVEGSEISVTIADSEDRQQRSLWGLTRTLVNNMVLGVTTGFSKKLELVGVGYKVAVAGRKVNMSLGFSHPVEIDLPEGITAEAEKTTLTLSGMDKQMVGEIAAQIRRLRKPEPYKGKGIRYAGEVVRRKAGKAAKAST